MNMICPHCKKQNYNDKAIECAYCHQNMKEKPVAPVVTVEQTPVQSVSPAIPQPATVEKTVQPVQESKPKKKVNKKKIITALVCAFVALILAGIVALLGYAEYQYKNAVSRSKSDPVRARYTFEEIFWYKDSADRIEIQNENIFNAAKAALAKQEIETAESYLMVIPDYEGVDELYKEIDYQKGIYHFDRGEYATAKKYFAKTEGYKDTTEYLNEFGCALRNDGSYQVKTYTGPGDNSYLFYGDTVCIIKYLDSDEFTYELVKTKGKYLLCLNGSVKGGKVTYFDQPTPICYFKNPQYDKNGNISGFTSESISTGRETRYVFFK